MKKIAAVFCIVASLAYAGEKYLGTVAGTSGPTAKNNRNTSSSFTIPQMAKVTVQCDADAYVATDVATATSTNGVKVAQDTVFPTSVGTPVTVNISTDGGTNNVVGPVLSVIGVSGAVNCKVFERRGNE